MGDRSDKVPLDASARFALLTELSADVGPFRSCPVLGERGLCWEATMPKDSLVAPS